MGDFSNSKSGKAVNEVMTNLIDKGETLVAIGGTLGGSAGAGGDFTGGGYAALNLNEGWAAFGGFLVEEGSVNGSLPAPERHAGGVALIIGSRDAKKVLEGPTTSEHADVDMAAWSVSLGAVTTNYNNPDGSPTYTV